MLRYREMSCKGSEFSLITRFIPNQDSEISMDPTAVGISINFARKVNVISVYRPVLRWHDDKGPCRRVALPSPSDIKSEIDYLFNILSSLLPYETSQTQPEDFSALSD